MRTLLIWLIVFYICMFAWKDWYKALCLVVIFAAINERPDIPKTLLGVPGLSPFNIMIASVGFAWLSAKAKEVKFTYPSSIRFYYLWMFVLIIVPTIRLIVFPGEYLGALEDLERDPVIGMLGLVIDDLINPIKYLVPGMLMLWACNSRERFVWSLGAVMVLNIILALLIIKWMPLSALTEGGGYELEQRAIRVLDREIGYYRSDLAVILAGAAWAMYSIRYTLKSAIFRFIALLGSIASAFAIALTGGRIGMIAFVVTALVLSVFRWWRFLLVVPLLIVVIVAMVPAVSERMLQGIADDDGVTEETDVSSMTSGRAETWPIVIDLISERPIFGWGLRGMVTSGAVLETNFPHAHNAFLGLLLDGGIVLAVPVFIFFLVLIKYGVSLFRDSRNDLFVVAGGVGIAYVVSFMVGSIGGQTFYPMTSAISMWCAIGLMLRVYFERQALCRYAEIHNIDVKDIELWDPCYQEKDSLGGRFNN